MEDFKYTRGNFYSQVRATLLRLGLIAIEPRFEDVIVVDKYVPVRQPITKRPPDGLNLVRLIWILCNKWNEEFFGSPKPIQNERKR